MFSFTFYANFPEFYEATNITALYTANFNLFNGGPVLLDYIIFSPNLKVKMPFSQI